MSIAEFKLVAPFKPTGDQPQAIRKLVEGLRKGFQYQTLLGVTGSGKTFTMANVIEAYNRPTLVISHNKTLAAQLASEYKQFFPDNAVEYFVSDYDFYLPEAYVPKTDFYVAKRAQINPDITRLRNSTIRSLITREDTIVVASVSCLFGAGDPEEYNALSATLNVNDQLSRRELLASLVRMQYQRNDVKIEPGVFRVRGDVIDVYPAYAERGLRIQFDGDTIERLSIFDTVTGKRLAEESWVTVFPAKFNAQRIERIRSVIGDIKTEMHERVEWFKQKGRLVEAERLRRRTLQDIVALQTYGYCPGIENYSMFINRRRPGERPYTLFNYFPADFLLIIDESHMTIPQVKGMYHADKSRKTSLVEYGFRLPSAKENRPLHFTEFEGYAKHVIFTSATPGPFENRFNSQTVQQLLRPTGLLDPEVSIRPSEGQVEDLVTELQKTVEQGNRALVTTLTKRYSEQLTDHLVDSNIKARYLHSEVETVERIQIIRELRQGEFDVLVGINLLREGLDLPEVALVAIFDADKEGFLRTEWALVQTMGRAARNVHGKVILYADGSSKAMRTAIDETNRRRSYQMKYNDEHGVTPTSIQKAIKDIAQDITQVEEGLPETEHSEVEALANKIVDLEEEMREAATNLEFEKAAKLRDQIAALRSQLEGGSE